MSIKFCVVHEAMNGCKNIEIHLRLALKMLSNELHIQCFHYFSNEK